MIYPPRFKTAEDGIKALKENDWSGAIFPFVEKDGRLRDNSEYEDAPFEMGLVEHTKTLGDYPLETRNRM